MEAELIERVKQAAETASPLCIRGGGSKTFYGRHCDGELLDVSGHRGIVSYEPSELVVTARAGTPLAEIEAVLAEHGQLLPFEPPHFGPGATLGGMVAAGLSGPRRPWGGSVRDAVLGVRLINGRGEALRFGGQVMKNVAGYDLSRLMAGALGSLGVLLEVSVKVLPRPAEERTRMFELSAEAAAARQLEWGRLPLSLSGTLYEGERLYVRLCGSAQGVAAGLEVLGGEAVADAPWQAVREQTLPFFQGEAPLWRISLPAAAPALNLPGACLTEWGGALRWLRTDLPAELVRQRAAALGGHATLFRGHDGRGEVFTPLAPALLALHQRVKRALDPQGIFNPGRMYAGL
ncbi:MAG: glycolate oxidase FAD binding subunit [bacterium]|nr:MAG: glycolate oxidase FAD binding subunit [bacterium]KAF0147408.1 MAG: glycolate oxidase FAD binding subunit [bacterium]KAF0167409.1 MAG: glycolate oxidase FAD binding subunit [bacterium]